MTIDKAVDSVQLDGYFTDIADAIRAKTGGSSAMTPAEMVTEIESIETGSSEIDPADLPQALLDNGYDALLYTGNEPYDLIAIGNGLYARRRRNATIQVAGRIRSATLLGVKNIPDYAFVYESNLVEIDLTGIENIGVAAFQLCTSLQEIEIPDNLITLSGDTGMEAEAVFNGSGLLEINTNNLTSLGRYFVQNCTSLTKIIAPKATVFRYQGARGCTSLETVEMPVIRVMLDTGNGQQFYGCSSLRSAVFGSINNAVESIGNQAFYGCQRADLVITVFTQSSFINTLVANIRNGAVNATIIVKASHATVYNGTEYQAGDTILTSTP